MKALAINTALIFVLGVCDATAAILYNPTPIGSSARISDYGSADETGFRSFDNFTVGGGGTVEKVSWRGFWLDQNSPTPSPAPGPDVLDWEIAFHADNAGAPGTQLFFESFAAASVSSTFDGTGVFNAGGTFNVSFYSYSVDLTNAFAVAPATQYWVSILSRSTSYQPVFAFLGATGADDLSWQQFLGAGMSVVSETSRARDRAITLEGTVPEPGTLGIGAVSLLLLPILRRRLASHGKA